MIFHRGVDLKLINSFLRVRCQRLAIGADIKIMGRKYQSNKNNNSEQIKVDE